jgi:hypothetical protein
MSAAVSQLSQELRETQDFIPFYYGISLLGIHPKEIRLVYQRNICILMLIAALFTIATE